LALVLATAASRVLSSDDPETRIVAAHAGGILLGMRLGSALLWPADYGPRALGDGPGHLREAVSRPPVFRRDRSLLESDGDPWTSTSSAMGCSAPRSTCARGSAEERRWKPSRGPPAPRSPGSTPWRAR